MKAAFRKKFSDMISVLETMSAELQEIHDTEEERYDNLSEKAQENEKGQKLQAEIGDLQTVINNIDFAVGDLSNLAGDE